MSKFAEFILPFLAASAEGVLWVLLAATLFLFGKGFIEPSEKAISINRVGRYSMRLEPGLNLAQPFIEAAAERIAACKDVLGAGTARHFEVFDKSLATRKQSSYLLSIRHENGHLMFEARPYADKPDGPSPSAAGKPESPLDQLLQTVAAPLGIRLHAISAGNTA